MCLIGYPNSKNLIRSKRSQVAKWPVGACILQTKAKHYKNTRKKDEIV